MKTCTRCLVEKPLAEFYKKRNGTFLANCKPCESARVHAWREANREQHRAYRREYKKTPKGKQGRGRYNRLKRYGLSEADHAALLAAQDGKCAGCGRMPPVVRTLFVDHDHVTGRVRGLLCATCNGVLGRVAEREEVLEGLLAYLRRSRAAL